MWSNRPVRHVTVFTDSRGFALLATFRCLIMFCFFGIGLTLMGIFMTAIAHNDPFKDDEFFKKHSNNPFKTVGPILLSIGIFLLLAGLVVFIIAMKKGYNIRPGRRQQQQPQAQYASSPLQQNYPPQMGPQPYNQPPQPSYAPPMTSLGPQPYNTSPPPAPGFQPGVAPPYPVQQYPGVQPNAPAYRDDLPPPYTDQK